MTEAASLSNSARVRERIRLLVSNPLGLSRLDLDEEVAYVDYLVLLHMIVRASVPLMREAADVLAGRGHVDPLATPLGCYFEHHIQEELAHDEWLLEDLEKIGVDRSYVMTVFPSPHVAAAVGAQYYWIRHYHPVTLLGYIAFLEGHPPNLETIRAWRDRTGLPPAAFRTLERHAALDPTHNRELDELIDSLPLCEAEVTSICVSALATLMSLTLAFDDVCSRKNG